MRIVTEGVLILASSKSLINEYKTTEFDYSFPNGISELLRNRKIIALTTNEGDDLIIDFNESSDLSEAFKKEINQYIELEVQDELLVLSHAEFTEICDNGGNIKDYKWPIQKIENLESGIYHVNIKVENLSDRFSEFNAYFRLTINVEKSLEIIESRNEVIDISI